MAEALISIFPLLIGPAGGFIIVVCILAALLYGIWVGVQRFVVPVIKLWFEKQEQHIEKLMASHEEDRKVFREAIDILSTKLGIIDKKVETIEQKVEQLVDDLMN